MRLLNFKFGFQ